MYISDHVITSKHYLVLCVFSYASGIFVFARSNGVVALMILTLSVALSLAALATKIVLRLSKKQSNKIYPRLTLVFVLAVSLILGMTRIYLAESPRYNPIHSYTDTEGWVYGTVVSDPTLTSKGYSCAFQLDAVQIGKDSSVRGTMIVYGPSGQLDKVKLGDNVYFWASINKPELLESDAFFDYYMNLRGKNIFITANTRNINIYSGSFSSSPITHIKNFGQAIRGYITNAADNIIPDDYMSRAILKGILIGDKSEFNDEMYRKFANSGISHIVAVSGLHISILFSLLALLFSSVRLNKRLSLFASVPFILTFMSASAFTPSVCRASIMIMVTVLAVLCHEEYDPVTSLFFAFGIIITVSPYSLFSKSLVLSFAATFGIFVYYPYLYHFVDRHLNILKKSKGAAAKITHKTLSFLGGSLMLSVSTFLTTAYFIAFFFQKVSYIQFLTNLWIIPTVFVVFCLGYIVCIIYYVFPFLASILSVPLTIFLSIIKATVNCFGSDIFALSISGSLTAMPYSLWWFAGLLIVYLILKALYDTSIEKKKAAERFGRL